MSKKADDDYNEESAGSGSDSDIDRDDELIDANDEDDSEDVAEFRPDGTHERLKADYPTFEDFEKDLRRYSAATFQTFIKRRTEKLPVGHAQQHSIVYRKIHFACVHHEIYRSKGSGKRPVTRSRRKGCGAGLSLYAHLRRNVLHLQTINEVHPLSESVWEHLPENRRLDDAQTQGVLSLVDSNVPTVAIKKQLSKNLQKVITTQDVANIRNKHDRKERAGRSEEQMIDFVLEEFKKRDPDMFVDVATSEAGTMKSIFWSGHSSRTCFIHRWDHGGDDCDV